MSIKINTVISTAKTRIKNFEKGKSNPITKRFMKNVMNQIFPKTELESLFKRLIIP